MTITLPDLMRDELESKAKAAGFASVNGYVIALVTSARPSGEAEDVSAGPPEITPGNRAELERMLEEGMNSGPPVRATPEFWDERRRVLEERLANRPEPRP